jgi:hypothetical protein
VPPTPTAPPAPATGYPVPTPTTSPMNVSNTAPVPVDAPPEDPNEPKKHKAGDFDAGGKVRLPNGPDEMGEHATFNWIALDLVGRYFLLPSVTINGNIPLAVKKPDTIAMGAIDPKLIGGISLRFDAIGKAPKTSFVKYDVEAGIQVTAAFLREGAMLLSDKDYPLFVGDLKPGVAAGLLMKAKLSSLVDFSLIPTYVYQAGTEESIMAVQFPMALILNVGSVAKLAADFGVFTGDDFSFGGDSGGRIYLGAALDLKLGPIILHTGAGFASLLTGAFYPTVGDSVYLDVNVKYAK